MEEWEKRLSELNARLAEWRRRFEEEFLRVRKERRLNGWHAWLRKPRPEDLQAAATEARKRAGVEILVELQSFLDELCDHYPTVLPQEQAKIRARAGMAEAVFDLLWGYVELMPERIRASADSLHVRRAFAAIAIDDGRTELHLIDDVMRRIVVAAAAAGIDWRGPLAESAKVANPGMGGGGAFMQPYLAGYERSDFFRQHVAAEVKAAERRAPERPVAGTSS